MLIVSQQAGATSSRGCEPVVLTTLTREAGFAILKVRRLRFRASLSEHTPDYPEQRHAAAQWMCLLQADPSSCACLMLCMFLFLLLPVQTWDADSGACLTENSRIDSRFYPFQIGGASIGTHAVAVFCGAPLVGIFSDS